MENIGGVRMSARSCSSLTTNNVAALSTVWRCLNTLGMEICRCVIE